MEKNREISHLVRDLVENDGDRGSNTHLDIHQITRSDNQSVNKIMHHITDQIHDSKRMHMGLGDGHMTVISMDNLFSY